MLSIPKSVTVDELAQACRVSPITIRRRIDAGEIRAFRVGRSVRIPVAELERICDGAPRDVSHSPTSKSEKAGVAK